MLFNPYVACFRKKWSLTERGLNLCMILPLDNITLKVTISIIQKRMIYIVNNRLIPDISFILEAASEDTSVLI